MAVTMEQLQQELAALKAQVDGITAPPTDYYTSRWSGEEIDNGVARALPGGGIDTALDGKLSTNLGGVAGKFDVLDGVYKAGDYVWLDETGEIGVTGALYILRVAAPQYGPHPATQQTLLQAYPVMPNANIRIRTHYYAGGWTPWQQLANTANLCNPNLIDNWYFVGGGGPGQFPVNQRGQTEYTDLYGMDRWLLAAQVSSLKIEPTHIVLKNYLVQQFSIQYHLFPLTFAILYADGTLGVAHDFLDKYTPCGHCQVQYARGQNALYILGNASIVAVKMEMGSTQTLAHKEGDTWALNGIPNYAEQLARCQRYALVLGDDVDHQSVGIGVARSAEAISVVVPIPTTMRALPAVSLTGTIVARHGDGQVLNITGAVAEAISGGSLMLRCGTVGATPGDAYDVFLAPKAKMVLSADL